MKQLLHFVMMLVYILGSVACSTKAYPDEKFVFDSNIRAVFLSASSADTLYFVNDKARQKIFIAEVDSILKNKKGGLMDPIPYKMLRVRFREIGKDTLSLERESEMFINKYPNESKTSYSLRFNNFAFNDSILPPLSKDTLNINGLKIYNYYIFETSLGSRNADDINTLYVTKEKGIVAFKTRSEEYWIRR
jgi:hypothetical protein